MVICIGDVAHFTHLKLLVGDGGTVTISNVQSNGGAHWVALYYANGDSTWRNVTVRLVAGDLSG